MQPVLQALILADRVYKDAATGKHVIAGTFNKLYFSQNGAKPRTVEVGDQQMQVIPGGMQAGSPHAYISLTEVRGDCECVLRYVSLKQDKPLFEMRFRISCDDPLSTVEMVFPLPNLPHIEGVHALELLCDDSPVGSHRVIVEEVEESADGDNPGN